jgi:Na+/H+-dicarboxylate symporter
MMMHGTAIEPSSRIYFICMLCVVMVAAPGVPGGAIMAAVSVLQSILGFDANQIAMMIALYITMDNFGTACNVTGDGAIALIIDKLYKK